MKNRKILLVGMLAMLAISCKKEIKEIVDGHYRIFCNCSQTTEY